jgi:hydroxypyruvate isomerase
MKPVICFEMLYADLKPTQKIAKIAQLGFKHVEFWGWRDKSIPDLISACNESQVNVVNFSGHRKGSLVAADTHSLFFEDLEEALSVANQLKCSTLMLLTNELGEGGVVNNTYPDIPQGEQYQNVRRGLEKALTSTPDDIALVLEPLNTLIDHPGYYLADMETAVSLIREVNHPRLKILCDLYHFGVMGQDLKALITQYVDDIGYIHIADFPGRHEPGTGSADWPALLTLLKEGGYTGYIGFEYSPLNDSEESLQKIRALWDQVMSSA